MINYELTGKVFNIQRFSTHDGPGIRTTVFLKGCPLKCFWCQNPESQDMRPLILYSKKLCTGCGRCIDVCPVQAISRNGQYTETDRDLCTGCGKCIKACLVKARRRAGDERTVAEIIKEVLKDRHTYENSGGGVTVSGGDPVYQHAFTLEILRACHEEYLTTAIETSGFASWEVMRPLAEEADFIYFDMKCMNSARHREGTAVPNEPILENAKRIVEMGKNIHFRMPLIPGFNDDDDSVIALREFVKNELKISVQDHVELLKYNKLAEEKYDQIGRYEDKKDLEVQSDERFEYLKALLYED